MALVLVVDDEEYIVILASLALKRAGYKTIRATSGQQALEAWTGEVDVLLTDCVMPDLFGDQLAARLLEQKPSLKVLFMSGNPAGSLELSVPMEENVNFIQKPFEVDALVGLVGRALAGQESKLNKG
jgi:two-component system cell cycle sensor histidine kinase/response regulator CckA